MKEARDEKGRERFDVFVCSLAERVNINARDETYFNFSGLDFAIERNHSGAAEVAELLFPR